MTTGAYQRSILHRDLTQRDLFDMCPVGRVKENKKIYFWYFAHQKKKTAELNVSSVRMKFNTCFFYLKGFPPSFYTGN